MHSTAAFPGFRSILSVVVPGSGKRGTLGSLLALSVWLAAAPGPALAQVEVNTCGQSIGAQDGFLAADLDCTGHAGNAVTIDGGSLDLRGFTLTGGDDNAVRCPTGCEVFSAPPGGVITGAAHAAISIADYGSPTTAKVHDIVITGNGSPDTFDPGVTGPDSGLKAQPTVFSSVKVENVTFDANTGNGIAVGKVNCRNCAFMNNTGDGIDCQRASVRDSTFDNNGGAGISGVKVSVKDSAFTNNGATDPYQASSIPAAGVVATEIVKIKGATLTGNTPYGAFCWNKKLTIKDALVDGSAESGVATNTCKTNVISTTIQGHAAGAGVDSGNSVKVKNSLITGNVVGVVAAAPKAKILGSQIFNNATHGVYVDSPVSGDVSRITVRQSILTGNGAGPTCGVTETCADISSDSRPNMTWEPGVNDCTISYNILMPPLVHWGVCELDCQNGTVNLGEDCDDGVETAACDEDCTVAFCGDSHTNPAAGEECDDGGTAYEDGCDGLCQTEFCGDLLVQAGLGETCDEGGDTPTCDGNCTAVACGDGYPNPAAGEQCDDGNTDNGDGCDSACQEE